MTRLVMTCPGHAWQDARDACAALGKTHAYGHEDWRLPTSGELDILFNKRAAIGGFNQTGDLRLRVIS